MKIGWVAISLMMLLFCQCGHSRPNGFIPNANNCILWGKRPIDWEDFRGLPEWTMRHADKSAVALTGCIVDFKRIPRGNSLDVYVRTYFLKDSSWVLIGQASPSVLHHEIGHFNTARLLRGE